MARAFLPFVKGTVATANRAAAKTSASLGWHRTMAHTGRTRCGRRKPLTQGRPRTTWLRQMSPRNRRPLGSYWQSRQPTAPGFACRYSAIAMRCGSAPMEERDFISDHTLPYRKQLPYQPCKEHAHPILPRSLQNHRIQCCVRRVHANVLVVGVPRDQVFCRVDKLLHVLPALAHPDLFVEKPRVRVRPIQLRGDNHPITKAAYRI